MEILTTKCQLTFKANISGLITKMVGDYSCPIGTIDNLIVSDFQ